MQRDMKKCRVWLIVRSVLTGILLASFLVNVAREQRAERFFSILEIALHLYCMCVVYAFIGELREEAPISVQRNFYGNKA
jgi:hypothetical protein